MGGRSGVVEEALDRARPGPPDHAEAMLHGEWGGELRAPGAASCESGRGECALRELQAEAPRMGSERAREGGPRAVFLVNGASPGPHT